MKTIEKKSLIHYIVSVAVFLCFMAINILLFFFAVQKSTDKSTRNTIQKNVQQQTDHFSLIVEEQYRYLEGIADYMGQVNTLICPENLELITSLSEYTSFHRITLFDDKGMGYTSDHAVQDAYCREYFQDSIAGRRGLSDPLESLIDGARLVVLSVPAYGKDGTPTGVLGASYNVAELSQILFSDLYDDQGYTLIANQEGTLISIDERKQANVEGGSIFEYFGTLTYRGHDSIKLMKQDFLSRKANCIRAARHKDIRYLAYQPLPLHDWVLCYVVPVSAAQRPFAFIKFYELALSGLLAAGVVLLLTAIWMINRKSQSSLAKKARQDTLTGLLNKGSTEAEIREWLDNKTPESMQALLMIDLDNFKSINDTFGHVCGDEVLRQVAMQLKGIFRDSDIIGRAGGDEFIVLMKNIRMLFVVEHHLQDIHQKLADIKIKEAAGLRITCSIGAACAPNHGHTFKELYQHADEALYQSKQKGRSCSTIYGEAGQE